VIRPELIDELLQDTNPQELLHEDGLLKQLIKALVERCLKTELDTHLEQTKQKFQLVHPVHGVLKGVQ